jgi:oligopeptide/dipeptide ABC transporter ATP-binding protein
MELGAADEVINDSRHPYTRALVSVMPTPEPPKPGQRARRVILAGETPDAVNIPTGCRFHPRCPLAEQAGILQRCRAEEPPPIDLGGGRSSACWLAESGKPLPAVERRVGATADVAAGPGPD